MFSGSSGQTTGNLFNQGGTATGAGTYGSYGSGTNYGYNQGIQNWSQVNEAQFMHLLSISNTADQKK